MSQPVWKQVWATDYSALYEDTTGVYDAELEIAQEYEGKPYTTRYCVYRLSLDRLKVVHEGPNSYLVPHKYNSTWPHPVASYEEWFSDSLAAVARSFTYGDDKEEDIGACLVEDLCGTDISARACAYEAIGGYHGFDNFDSYPLDLSEEEWDERLRHNPRTAAFSF